jgi:acyl-CoA oxidase
MTEAHYDHSKKEFIIHSPNRDAMKFWIGAAANLATVAVVWAQLYIGETCHGVHVFIVPLRN